MPFASTAENNTRNPNIGGGETFGDGKIVLSATTFEDGLKIGRFAKLDTGSIDNMDSSSSPVIAGVVARNVTNAIESEGTYTQELNDSVDFVRSGLCSVYVKDGAAVPAQFATVYASNGGDANDGLAQSVASGGVDSGAEFIEEIASGVWLVRIK